MIDSLNDGELEEKFERSSGPGGQNVNKVATKVHLRHVPTGLSVTVQDTRSQAENRKLARERLLQMLNDRDRLRREAQEQAREKERRQKRQRPRAIKRRFVEGKRRRAQIRQMRKSTSD